MALLQWLGAGGEGLQRIAWQGRAQEACITKSSVCRIAAGRHQHGLLQGPVGVPDLVSGLFPTLLDPWREKDLRGGRTSLRVTGEAFGACVAG